MLSYLLGIRQSVALSQRHSRLFISATTRVLKKRKLALFLARHAEQSLDALQLFLLQIQGDSVALDLEEAILGTGIVDIGNDLGPGFGRRFGVEVVAEIDERERNFLASHDVFRHTGQNDKKQKGWLTRRVSAEKEKKILPHCLLQRL